MQWKESDEGKVGKDAEAPIREIGHLTRVNTSKSTVASLSVQQLGDAYSRTDTRVISAARQRLFAGQCL